MIDHFIWECTQSQLSRYLYVFYIISKSTSFESLSMQILSVETRRDAGCLPRILHQTKYYVHLFILSAAVGIQN